MPPQKTTRKKLTKPSVESKNYFQVFEQLKADIIQSQLQAALLVTRELAFLYWRIGKTLSAKAQQEGWGAKTLERLARDLKATFISGFSYRNFKYMRQFAEAFPEENWAAVAAQIPWGHNMLILDKVEDLDQRL